MSEFGNRFFEDLLKRIKDASIEEVRANCLKAEATFKMHSQMLESLNKEEGLPTYFNTTVRIVTQASNVPTPYFKFSQEFSIYCNNIGNACANWLNVSVIDPHQAEAPCPYSMAA